MWQKHRWNNDFAGPVVSRPVANRRHDVDVIDVDAMLVKYRAMTYDDLANAAIRLGRVIERDTEIGATRCVEMNNNYLRLMDRVMREKNGTSS